MSDPSPAELLDAARILHTWLSGELEDEPPEQEERAEAEPADAGPGSDQFAADLMEAARIWWPLWQVTPRRIAIASPAVGTEWVTTVPANVTWFVQAVTAQMLTSAVAATRVAALQATAPEGVYLRCGINGNQTAATTWRYWWLKGLGLSYATQSTQVMGSFPVVPLLAGHTLGSFMANLQAGDQWSLITVTVFQVAQRPDIDTAAWVASLRDGATLQDNNPALIIGLG